jgi:hypothetical protein
MSDVHTAHCSVSRCKYGDDDCTMSKGTYEVCEMSEHTMPYKITIEFGNQKMVKKGSVAARDLEQQLETIAEQCRKTLLGGVDRFRP